MSTVKPKIPHNMRDGEHDLTDQEFDRSYLRRKPEPLPKVFRRLSDNSNNIAILPNRDTLEKDIAHGIHALNCYLTQIDCPGRDLIAYVVGLSDGSARAQAMTDARICQASGKSERWVSRQREQLKDWIRKTDFAVVTIIEGDYDKELRQNKPTQYEVHAVAAAAQILRTARASDMWRVNHEQAIMNAAILYVENTPSLLGVRLRKKTRVLDPEGEVSKRRKLILTHLEKIRDFESHLGRDPKALWDFMKRQGDEIFETEPFPVAAPKPKSRLRQERKTANNDHKIYG